MIWSYHTLIFFFFLPIACIIFCPPVSPERKALFPFFRWEYFVLLGLDQLASIPWRCCGYARTRAQPRLASEAMLFLQLHDAIAGPLFGSEVEGNMIRGRGWKELFLVSLLPHTSWVTLASHLAVLSLCSFVKWG